MTKNDESPLSVAQDVAIAALLRGVSVTDAATEAGVARQTVSGWRHNDPAFIAALNRGRRDIWDQVEDQLRGLHVKALNVIDNALDGPKATDVAVDVVKVLARMNITPTGSTSEEEVETDQFLRRISAF